MKFGDLKFFVGYQMQNANFSKMNMEENFYPIFTYSISKFEQKVINDEKILKSIPCDKFEGVEKINSSNFNLSDYICPDLSGLKNESFGGDYE